jgi:hypothetical protein
MGARYGERRSSSRLIIVWRILLSSEQFSPALEAPIDSPQLTAMWLSFADETPQMRTFRRAVAENDFSCHAHRKVALIDIDVGFPPLPVPEVEIDPAP